MQKQYHRLCDHKYIEEIAMGDICIDKAYPILPFLISSVYVLVCMLCVVGNINMNFGLWMIMLIIILLLLPLAL